VAHVCTFNHPPVAAPRSVNEVVPTTALLPTALAWARLIIANSPDAVTATKRSLILAQQAGGGMRGRFEDATVEGAFSPESRRTYGGENIRVSGIGVLFVYCGSDWYYMFIIMLVLIDIMFHAYDLLLIGRTQGVHRGEARFHRF
jgi:hypothetical protein